MKLSGHSTIAPLVADRAGAWRRANHDVNVSSANAGTSRSGAIPPRRFASDVPAMRFTSRGAFDAIREN